MDGHTPLTMRLSGISTTQGYAGEYSPAVARDRVMACDSHLIREKKKKWVVGSSRVKRGTVFRMGSDAMVAQRGISGSSTRQSHWRSCTGCSLAQIASLDPCALV